MDKSCLSYWKHLSSTSLACALGVSLPYLSTPLAAQESVVQKEINRRAANTSKAHELLTTGDSAYHKKDYSTAVKNYSEAFSLLPISAKTEEIRVIAGVRYATAATEQARKLAKRGDYQAAKDLLDTVLRPEIAPTHVGALKLRGQIDDPTRYNPALTPDHVSDAAKVGRHLREAEGFVSLGQYDRALTVYRSVLQIDPFNQAARRGMERVNVIKSDYYRSAQDQTRAELLSQVDAQWELTVPPAQGTAPSLPLTGSNQLAPDVRDRLVGITVEVVDLENATLSEAIDFIRLQSRIGDIPGPDGEKTGINIVLNAGPDDTETARRVAAARVTLKLRNVPLSKLLDYITDQTRTQWRTDGVGVLITPLGSIDGTIISRSFRVPPNFLTSTTTKQEQDTGNIFDSDTNDRDGGILPTKISITDFLKQNGISFPEGASATYSASTNTLTVRNTANNIDLADQLVGLIADEEPVLVKIETTIMRVSQQHIQELGFEWAITPLGLGSGTFLGGGTLGNGAPLGPIPTPPGITLNSNPVTAGNRSGDGATQADAIDTFLNAPNTGAVGGTTNRAPGILSLTYIGSGFQVQMMMRGLDQKTGADVLVKPSTIARSGERSRIEVIREFIYPTEYEPPELPNNVASTTLVDVAGNVTISGAGTPVTPSTPTAFDTRNVGVTLEVEPTVGPNRKFIELSLNPELVEFEGFINFGSPIIGQSGDQTTIGAGGGILAATGASVGEITDNSILMPVFQTTRIPNQSITIQDGHTIVLGGLMTSRKTKVEDKTPILGDIPYVGRLFRTEAEDTFNEAVIISVTAELIDPAGRPWRNR